MIYAWLICILLFLLAITYSFYWDWAGTYVGVGMMCPYNTIISVLLGAILGYTYLLPEINKKNGEWYTEDAKAESFHGFGAYKVMSSSILTTLYMNIIYIIICNCTAHMACKLHSFIYLSIWRLKPFFFCVCVVLSFYIDDSW